MSVLHKLIVLVVAAMVLASCNTTKFLGVDEFLLEKNEIKFEGKEKVDNKRKLKYELSTLYKQKKNSNFFFIPREYFYFKNQQPEDTSKFDRWVRRVIAEPPAIYDQELTQATAEAMQYYLQYKGYFNANVYPDEYIKGKKAYVTYYVKPKERFTIDSIFFQSEDPNIERILRQTKARSLLKPGEGLDGNLYEREKERITQQLRNSGYADFLPNYFATLEADTTVQSKKANVYLEILPPSEDSLHQVYYVGDVRVFTQYDPSSTADLRDTVIQDIHFRTPDTAFSVKPQVIIDQIYLQPGELFRQENYEKTNRSLSALGVFRFVRIKQEQDSVFPNRLNFRIELTDNSRIEVGVDFELNYTNRSTSSASGNLIGLSISPSMRHRNIFGGAEQLLGNLSAGLEVNPSFRDDRFWNTVDLQASTDLYLPKFADYLGIWKGISKIGQDREKAQRGQDFYTQLQEKATTRLSVSYNYLRLLDFYRYNLFNANYGFELKRSGTRRYNINHVGIDYLQPFSEPAFREIQRSNPFLDNSFGQQLFVSLLFRDFDFIYNGRPNEYGESVYFSGRLEMAGAEIYAGNAIYNAFALKSDTLRLGQTDFSQYAKMELDFRYYKQFNQKHSLATRFALGIARPFGYTDDVPYVKQFYVGGPSSIRAWPARGLGPGGYLDTLTFKPEDLSIRASNRLLFYQTGDLKLEFNLEYRFNIFWRFKGALFLDGGNIWTITEDPSRCGSQFRWSAPANRACESGQSFRDPFYKQIALGTGLGFRFDFTYFIFRLDLGVRLRNPIPLPGPDERISESDYWTDFSQYQLRDINFNIGLGYPF